MIQGLVILLLFQGLGEICSKFLKLPIPGPVLGLVFLLCFFHWKASVPESVDTVASGMTQHLGLLFIPASVGVVKFMPQLQAWGGPIALVLIASVTLSIGMVAWILKRLDVHSPPEANMEETSP